MQTARLDTMELETDGLEAASAADDRAQYWSDCLRKVAVDRDRAAFREVFRHFAPMVKAFAYKVPGLDQSDQFAEELLQETMLKVWLRADSFDATLASPSTWIFTIARNMRIDLLRKLARHVVNSVPLHQEDEDGEVDLEAIWFVDESSDLFNQLAQQRSRRQIRESLATLPPEQTEVLAKVYLEDKSHAEVAQELGLPLGTVKSRVRLALNKLKLIVDR